MKNLHTRRPQLALPFTILTEPDTVRLVAGEDFRYTLTAPQLDRWLPRLLAAFDGRPVSELLPLLAANQRAAALQWVERLYGERILMDAPPQAVHQPARHSLQVEGTGQLVEVLSASFRARSVSEGEQTLAHASGSDIGASKLLVYCQDRLDFDAALRFNRACRKGTSPWLWATYGPLGRGFVSSVFLPDAGPCLKCLIRQFQRLSPAPEIYDALIAHAREGGAVEPSPFPEEGVAILASLVRWKRVLLAEPEPPAALFRLHVLEAATLEVTAHSVFVDPTCPECGSNA